MIVRIELLDYSHYNSFVYWVLFSTWAAQAALVLTFEIFGCMLLQLLCLAGACASPSKLGLCSIFLYSVCTLLRPTNRWKCTLHSTLSYLRRRRALTLQLLIETGLSVTLLHCRVCFVWLSWLVPYVLVGSWNRGGVEQFKNREIDKKFLFSVHCLLAAPLL